MSKEMSVLVKYCGDWADEMTIEGFRLFETEADWKTEKKRIENFFKLCGPYGPYTFCLGTNEEIEMYSISDFTDCITEYIIPKETYDVMVSVFGSVYAFFPEFEPYDPDE